MRLILVAVCFACALARGNLQEGALRYAILAGTQKSGSTVLASLLARQSSILFAKHKELHFFDRTKNFKHGIQKYTTYFGNASSKSEVLCEATPYYIASRTACQRIAQTIPGTKLIILLREPVARAYSEYQMKLRRVTEQISFFAVLSAYAGEVHSCLVDHSDDFSAVKGCVPLALSAHSRWGKFVTALKRAEAKVASWSDVVKGCFRDADELAATESSDLTECSGKTMDWTTYIPNGVDHISWSGRNSVCRLEGACSVQPEIIPTAANVSNASQNRHFTTKAPLFDPQGCWKYYPEGYEEVQTVRVAFMHEIEDFRTCVQQYAARHNKSDLVAQFESLSEALHPAQAAAVLEVVDGAVDACIDVQGGISSQYFYRSMYAVQLHHCFKSIPREDVLVIPSGRLRRNATAVLAQVFEFLNLSLGTMRMPDNWEGSEPAGESVAQVVKKSFPNFAASTGWSANSAYAPMPVYLQSYVSDYFVPHNRLLFSLLGRDLTDEW